MLLAPFYTRNADLVSVSAQQACDFAKQQCFDFNPLHDVDSRRFCVPGDLLVSLALDVYGVSESMTFTFTNMVGADVGLIFPKTDADNIIITNEQGKSVLEISRKGNINKSREFSEALIKSYGQFSGQNFPTRLLPLLKEHDVMFNPKRPLAMYNSMHFEFSNLNFSGEMTLASSKSTLDVETKRATSFLHFDVFDEGKLAGTGVKELVIAGIRPYEHDVLMEFVTAFEARVDSYQHP